MHEHGGSHPLALVAGLPLVVEDLEDSRPFGRTACWNGVPLQARKTLRRMRNRQPQPSRIEICTPCSKRSTGTVHRGFAKVGENLNVGTEGLAAAREDLTRPVRGGCRLE